MEARLWEENMSQPLSKSFCILLVLSPVLLFVTVLLYTCSLTALPTLLIFVDGCSESASKEQLNYGDL